MGRIKRRPAAKRDLIEIHKHIAENAPTRADPFLIKINEKPATLSEPPLIGAARLLRFPDVRVFPIGNYLIIHVPLPDGEGIELIRVYHGARDWEAAIEHDLP